MSVIERLGGQQQRGDAGRVLQRGADDLGRIDDAGLDQVAVLVLVGVVAVVLALHLPDAVDDHRAVDARRSRRSPAADSRARCATISAPCFSSPSSSSLSTAFSLRSSATPPPGTMPSSSAACVARLGVFDQRLALLHFGLGRRADVDLGHAAGQLGQPLLQLLAVVVAVGRLDLACGSARPGRRSPSLSPPPPTIVVFSVVMMTFLAVPRSESLTPSSSTPRSLKIAVPPVSVAMSPSMALRRSP